MLLIFYLFFILVIILTFKVFNHKEGFITKKEEYFRDVLDKCVQALNSIGVPFFLSSGTCLGYFRENKFMDHDYDIDIGVLRSDFKPEILETMKNNGFKLYHQFGSLEDGLEYQFLYNNIRIDIFLHYPETIDNKEYIYWNALNFNHQPPKKIKYRVDKFNIKKVKFYDIEVGVPDDTLKYIEQHYGKDWKIPKTSGYNYITGPKSIVS